MTRETSTDLKKGSADACATGQPGAGLPGQAIADGESRDLGAGARGTSTEDAGSTQARAKTIPEQAGCGPNVTDYPGLDDKTPPRH